jgi:hypothetical protein
MLWRCARATSPGLTIEKVACKVCDVDFIGMCGFTRRIARRSACSMPMVSLAFRRPSSSGSHFQRYGASALCPGTRVRQKPESWFFSNRLSSSSSFIAALGQEACDIACAMPPK